MTNFDVNARILALKLKHNLSDAEFCRLLHISSHTLRAWRYPTTCKARRNATRIYLDRIEHITGSSTHD